MVSSSLEVRPDTPFPDKDAVVTCMDGFDRTTKVYAASELGLVNKCADMLTFTQLAEKIDLPLNVSKEVVCAVNAAILGCE